MEENQVFYYLQGFLLAQNYIKGKSFETFTLYTENLPKNFWTFIQITTEKTEKTTILYQN